MVPPKCSRRIAPGNICTERSPAVSEIKYIPSEISAQVYPVFFRKLIIHFHIQVIKIISRTIVAAGPGNKGSNQQVNICSPVGNDKRCFFFDQRTLDRQSWKPAVQFLHPLHIYSYSLPSWKYPEQRTNVHHIERACFP